MGTDFYRPPSSDASSTPSAATSAAPLYRTRDIGIAAFFGTPVGGLLLVHLNERRLGRTTQGFVALALSGAALVAMLVAALLLSDSTPRLLGLAGVVGTCVYAELTQGTEVRLSLAGGRPRGSGWRAAGIGALTGAAMFGLAVVAGLGLEWTRSRVDFGHDQLVFYESGASEEQAQKLGELLKNDGFFGDKQGAHVTLAKSGEGYRVSFILGNGWNDPDTIQYFEQLRPQISQTAVGSAPVTIELQDEWSTTQRTLK